MLVIKISFNFNNVYQAFDAVYLMAANKEGFYAAAGATRRHDGVLDGLFYVMVSNFASTLFTAEQQKIIKKEKIGRE